MSGIDSQTSHEWLKEIQQRNFEQHISRTHLETMKHVGIDLNDGEEMMTDPLGWADKRVHRFVVEPLLRHMPEGHRAKYEEVPVGTLFTRDPNACAIRPRDCTTIRAIVLDWMFMAFIWTVVAPILRLLDGPPLEERRTIAKSILNCGRFFSSAGRRGRIESLRFDESVDTMAGLIERGVLCFVLAHEYAHVGLGHLDPYSVGTFDEEVEQYTRDWTEEFAADTAGLVIGRGVLRHLESEVLDGEAVSNLPCTGPLVAMSLIHFLESFAPRGESYRSHPPARARRSRLAPLVRNDLTEHAGDVALWFEHVAGLSWADVED